MEVNRSILVVARWPLGGIRTYMRYMFRHFPEKYKITLLAASTQEDHALINDVEEYGASLRLVKVAGTRTFAFEIFKELKKGKYDLILSQGFVSAVAVYPGNLVYRIPHILTIHGIVEPQFVSGHLGVLKKALLGKVLSGVTVLYGVSNDILEHLYGEFSHLKHKGPPSIVILNGIEPAEFEMLPARPVNLRERLGIDANVFVFGFFGRFMPQKGFDLVIEAVALLRDEKPGGRFAILAVGSGDYLREYRAIIREKGLEQYFYFLPFQPMVHHLYPQVDAIVMPSRWEACPLFPMEVLCMGTPLIGSDCIGLRETIADTPTVVCPSGSVDGLVKVMKACWQDNNHDAFQKFIPLAQKRFDVSNSSEKLINYIENLLDIG